MLNDDATEHGGVYPEAVELSISSGAHLTDPSPEEAVRPEELPLRWSVATVAVSLALFLAAALAEIGGGWLVWQAVREGKPSWWALLGSLVLVLYGFIPTWQPVDEFGRTYAVYGGVFIVLSYLWGWLVDGMRMDAGDWIGSIVAVIGVAIAWFWPRSAA
uniref:Uncharacterized protein n=1 Tax=Tetraselmis chuii TaxID=63592 RepID=A0A7S1SWG8_9CHLO|mmetsp:Transcript_31542/g.56443  ORF Transcript_31542/g.56443 Transcript_31542/m.56443 type:complete len:160 (+) Transcript_31542:406-885(+)